MQQGPSQPSCWGLMLEPGWESPRCTSSIRVWAPAAGVCSGAYLPLAPPGPLACLLAPEASGWGQEGRHSSAFIPPLHGSENSKRPLHASKHPDVFCPYSFLVSRPCLFSRQNLLQPPVQLRGHAGDHAALCRLPRGRPWPAGRRCLLPCGVRPRTPCPQKGTEKLSRGRGRRHTGSVFHGGKVYITQDARLEPFSSVEFSSVTCVHTAVQPSPLPVARTFQPPKLKRCPC